MKYLACFFLPLLLANEISLIIYENVALAGNPKSTNTLSSLSHQSLHTDVPISFELLGTLEVEEEAEYTFECDVAQVVRKTDLHMSWNSGEKK